MNGQDNLTRRQLLGITVTAAVGAAAGAAVAADALPKLDEKDPMAVALHYVHDAKLVDSKKNPTYKPRHHCANCLHLTGKAGAARQPCNLFPKKLVAANGWCSAWVQPPGTA